MITLKQEGFREKIGKAYDVLVGEKEIVRGVYISIDGPIAIRVEQTDDSVVIEFAGDRKPKLRVNLPILDLLPRKIERITIYEHRAVIKLNNFPDIEIVEA